MTKKPIRPQKKNGTLVYGDLSPAKHVRGKSADFMFVDDMLKNEPEKSDIISEDDYRRNEQDILNKLIKQKNVKPKKLVIESDGTTKNTHLFIDGVEIVGCNWIIFESDASKPVISLNLKLTGVKK